MLDTLQIGQSGLLGFSEGLRVIAHNTANLNTPGFKGASLRFGDLVGKDADPGQADAGLSQGHGLQSLGTRLSLAEGELRQTSDDLDLAVNGDGWFVLQSADGSRRFTRDGSFVLDASGLLVERSGHAQVLVHEADGALAPLTTRGRDTHAGHPSTRVTLGGSLPGDELQARLGPLELIDATGRAHAFMLRLTRLADDGTPAVGLPADGSANADWQLELQDSAGVRAIHRLRVEQGQVTEASAQPFLELASASGAAFGVTLDLSAVRGPADAAEAGSLVVARNDGVPAGSLVRTHMGADGQFLFEYGNGQTVQGPRVALARFDSADDLQPLGGNRYAARSPDAVRIGAAGADGFGEVRGASLENSNVDLSLAFSELIVMQRGYQASSQLVTTANEMMQQLLSIKGGR